MVSIPRLVARHVAEDAREWQRTIDRLVSAIGTDFLRDACLTTLFVVTPVVLVYSGRALSALVVVALVFAILHALAATATRGETPIGRRIARGLRPSSAPWWVWCTLALLVYSGITSLWALDPVRALDQSFMMVATFFAVLILQRLAPPLGKEGHRIGAAIGMAIAAVVLIVELYGNGVLRAYVYGPNPAYLNRSVVDVSLLMWPTLALTTGRYRHWIRSGLVVLVSVAVLLSRSDSAMLAMAAGLLVTSMALISNRLAALGVIVVAAAAFVAMPLTVQVIADLAAETPVGDMVDLSAERRLEIWKGFSDIALQHPVLGWGLESSRFFGQWDVPGVDWTLGPVHHPHNPILQIWVELGVVGVALAGAIMLGVVLSVPRLPARRRSFAYGAITATLAISSVSHGAWQIWWICLLMLLVALFTFEERYASDTPAPSAPAAAPDA